MKDNRLDDMNLNERHRTDMNKKKDYGGVNNANHYDRVDKDHSKSNYPSHKERKRSVLTRLYSAKFVAFGIVVGLVFAVFAGVYIIYKDMMSGVTFADPTFAEPFAVKDLTDSEWLGGLKEAEKERIEDDFRELQDLLGQDTDEPNESSGDAAVKGTKGDKTKNVNTPEPQAPPKVATMNGIDNIVLFGVDSRANNFRGRADVVMLISINHNTKQINLVSLMRAMYVNIGISKHPWGMLNASYSYGGPSLAVRTIERNFGIPIKGYVAINFGSFIRIVDAVGGVGISLTDREAAYLKMEPGYHKMNGRQALAYSRIRKIDSDFQRNRRQRNVVNSILSAMASDGSRMYNGINVVLANTRTNLNLGQYLSPSYLSYQRRQMQLPAWEDTYRTYVRGMEVWPFKMANTHRKLVSFLTGK